MKRTKTYGELLMDLIDSGLSRFVLMKKNSFKDFEKKWRVRLARKFNISQKSKWLYYN